MSGMGEADMDKDRAQALIAAYGAAPERWPETERAALSAAIAADPALAALARAEDPLDRALAALRAPPEPLKPASLARALAGAPRSLIAFTRQQLSLAAGLAACAALGFAFGLERAANARLGADAEAALVEALSDPGARWEGLDG